MSDTSVLASNDTMYHAPDLSACPECLGALHQRLCPRQVLGVRVGLHAGRLLGMHLPSPEGSFEPVRMKVYARG